MLLYVLPQLVFTNPHLQYCKFEDKPDLLTSKPTSNTKCCHLYHWWWYNFEILTCEFWRLGSPFPSVGLNPSLGYLPSTLDPLGLLTSWDKRIWDYNCALNSKPAAWFEEDVQLLLGSPHRCFPAVILQPVPLTRLLLTPQPPEPTCVMISCQHCTLIPKRCFS